MFIPPYGKSPNIRAQQAGSGHTGTGIIYGGDFVTSASNVLTRAATNTSTNIFGLTNFGEQQIFGPYGGNPPSLQSVFGYTQAATGGPLIPEESLDITVYSMLSQQLFYINISNTTGWISGGTQQATYGTTGGLLLDTTTNLFVFDPTQSNKVMTIWGKAVGPNIVLPSGVVLGAGQVGDTGARVIAYFNGGVI
jgi:hypothetical protein